MTVTTAIRKMISNATSLAATAGGTLAGPAAAIVMAVIGLNLLGDALPDAFDPARGPDRCA